VVPVIDFRGKNVEKQMYDAYTTVGFAVFTNVFNTFISEFEDWFQVAQEFFNLPLETRRKYQYSGVKENIGYSWIEEGQAHPQRPGDLKESYNWVSPDRMKEEYWPTELPEFKPLAQKILRVCQLNTYEFLYKFESILKQPYGTFVENHVDGSATMSMIKYPVWEGEVKEDQMRVNEHSDFGSITLLHRFDDVSGLEIQNLDGEWIDVPVVENSIVLNVADMFQRWSNDTLRSAKHRVRATHLDKERWSMPYFVDPGRDVMIKNLTDQPAKYEPISGYEYLKWRLAQMYSPDTDGYEEKEKLKEDEYLTQHLY